MANPFSGLENIGASYMAGARLAQERQRRADEIAARQEEARIRQQYYQDIIAEREAARLATAGEREAQGATLFGKYLVRKADGTIDYQASQAAKQAGEEEGQFGAAYGALEARGVPIGPISPKIMQTPQFMAARAAGIDRRAAEAKAIRDSMLRAGYAPVTEEPAPAFGLAPELLREPRDTSQDVMIEGTRFSPTPVTRAKMAPKQVVEKPTVTVTTKDGDRTISERLTPAGLAERKAREAAEAAKEPGMLDDIEEAKKSLRNLAVTQGTQKFNLKRDDQTGKISIVPDTFWGGDALSKEQVLKSLELEKTKRQRLAREFETPSAENAAAATPLPQGTNRVTDILQLQGLPPFPRR